MNLKETLKENGFSEEDVMQWAQQKYPEFTGNFDLVAKLFAIEKGIPFEVPRRSRPISVIKISEIKPDVPCAIKGVVVQKIEERTYIGCPKCYRKLQSKGRVECEKDGVVDAVDLTWRSYLVGDDSGEIVVDTAPSVTTELKTGDVRVFRGSMRGNSYEFTVFDVFDAQGTQPRQTAEPKQVQVSEVKQTTETKQVTEPTTVQGYKCQTCGKEFKSEIALKTHVGLVHKDGQSKTEPKTEPKSEPKAEQKVEKKTETEKETKQTTLTQPTPTQTPVQTSAQTSKQGASDEIVTKLKVWAMLKRDYNTVKTQAEAMGVDEATLNGLMDSLGIKVVDGVLRVQR
jgi:DNA-directed RNA polymerase subunit RPC12/RpoP